jgi:CheY-like chemotaxis protein
MSDPRLRVRIVVADDHQGVLDRVVALLADEFSVVAAVRDGSDLVAAEADLQPDLVVADISMPKMSGIEAAAAIRRRGSRVPIISITACGPDLAGEALRAGATAVVDKASLMTDLLPAIRAALEDHALSPTLARAGRPQP